MVADRRRRHPQEHGSASQRAGARRGSPGCPGAGRAWSPCPRPRPASARPAFNVRGERPVSRRAMSTQGCPVSGAGVQCPVSDVGVCLCRCPMFSVASGIRAFPRLLCPNRARVVKRGGGAGNRTAGVGVVAPAVSTTGSPSARVGAWRSKLAQAVPGQWRRQLDLVVVMGGGWAVARSTAWPTRIGRMRARIARR
jgi:hypothetical protein